MGNAITDPLQGYLDGLVAPRPAELAAMEAHASAEGFPIIGPACGQVCYQIARLAGARRIFELGSGFGYSTAWLARAVRGDYRDYVAAEQAAMATDLLLLTLNEWDANKARVDAMFASVSDDEAFVPARFAAAADSLRKAL